MEPFKAQRVAPGQGCCRQTFSALISPAPSKTEVASARPKLGNQRSSDKCPDWEVGAGGGGGAAPARPVTFLVLNL